MSKGFFYAALVCFLWAVQVITPVWLPDFSALDIVFGRFLVFSLAVLAVLLFRMDTLSRVTVAGVRRRLLLACSGYVLFYLLLVASIQTLGVFPAVILLGALPLLSVTGCLQDGLWSKGALFLLISAFVLAVGDCREAECWGAGVLFLVISLILYTGYSFFQRRQVMQNLSLDANDQLLISGLAVIPWLLPMLFLLGVCRTSPNEREILQSLGPRHERS